MKKNNIFFNVLEKVLSAKCVQSKMTGWILWQEPGKVRKEKNLSCVSMKHPVVKLKCLRILRKFAIYKNVLPGIPNTFKIYL